MKEFVTHSPEQTQSAAAQLAGALKPGDIIAMRGEMGAGKTAFVHGLADGLQVDGEVASPTYSIVNEYPGKIPLYHFDMYRIYDADELYTTGFFDYLQLGGVCVVEWSENIDWALPENTIIVEIEKLSETDRKITVKADERF